MAEYTTKYFGTLVINEILCVIIDENLNITDFSHES